MKKAIGWVMLFLSGLLMMMCSQDPGLKGYAMTTEGLWMWLIWVGLLIGGSFLINSETSKKRS